MPHTNCFPAILLSVRGYSRHFIVRPPTQATTHTHTKSNWRCVYRTDVAYARKIWWCDIIITWCDAYAHNIDDQIVVIGVRTENIRRSSIYILFIICQKSYWVRRVCVCAPQTQTKNDFKNSLFSVDYRQFSTWWCRRCCCCWPWRCRLSDAF